MSKLANNGSNNTPIIRASQVDLSGKEYLFDWDKWTNKGFRKTLGMEYEYLADFFSQLNDMIVLKGNKKTKQPINKEPAPSKPEPKGKEPEPKEKDPEKKKKTEHKTTRERKPRPKVKIPPMPAMTPQQKERETDRVMRMHGVNVNNSTPERRQEISNFYGQFLDKTPDEISKILKDAIAKDKSHKLNPAVLTALDSAFTAYNPDSRVGGTQSKNAKDTFLKIMAELGSDNDKGRRIMMDVIPTEHMKIVLDAARSMDPNNSNKEFVMPYKSDLHNMGIDGLVIFGIQQALAKIDANDLSSEKASNMLKSARANIKEVREAYHDTYKANGRATKTIGKEATEASKFVDKEREKVNKELYKESVEKSIEEDNLAKETEGMSDHEKKNYEHDKQERAKLSETKKRLQRSKEEREGVEQDAPDPTVQEPINAKKYYEDRLKNLEVEGEMVVPEQTTEVGLQPRPSTRAQQPKPNTPNQDARKKQEELENEERDM